MKFAIAAVTATLFPLLSFAIPTPIEYELEKRAVAKVYSKCTESKTVALTFDDGPYIYESKIIDTLNKNGIKGTFFVNGDNYDCIYNSGPVASLKKAHSAGHQIASHTWAHLHLTKQSKDKITSEFSKVDTALKKILGVTPAFMRPPYGEYNDNVKSVAGSRKQNIVIWDFDDGDSTGASVTSQKNAYKNLAAKKPNTILSLNHEVYKTTADTVLPYAISQLKGKGYKFVTVAQCLGKSPYVSTTSPGKKDSTWHC